jgi:hypothetical protein
LWGIAVLGKLKFNGLVFGFDYGNYQPDGARYTFLTLKLLGVDQFEAAQQVSNWYQSHAFKMQDFSPSLLLDENSAGYALVKTRILYPLLSVVFVKFLGISGMLVVPALSLLALLLLNQYLSEAAKAPLLGFGVSILIVSSPTVMRWMVVNTTDSLLVALFAILVYLLSREKLKKFNEIYFSLFLITLIVLTSFTRFSLPIWLALSAYFVILKRLRTAMMIVLFSVICALPSIFSSFSYAQNPELDNRQGLHSIAYVPVTAAKVIFIEIAQLLILDKLLLSILALATFFAVREIRNGVNLLVILEFLAVWSLGTINGTLGVNFRYQLPLIPFILWSLYINVPKKMKETADV